MVRTGRREHKLLFAGGSGGGGGSIMFFTITEVDCPEGTGNWIVEPTFYSGGCGTIPGADEYTGEYTVIPNGCATGTLPDDLVGQVGVAAYVAPVDDCGQFQWRELVVCPGGGC